jgi:hypothetical protein
MGDDEKTFDAVGRRHFSVRRAADVEEFLSGGSIHPSAARRIHLTEKSFGQAASYATAAREVKAEANPACRRSHFRGVARDVRPGASSSSSWLNPLAVMLLQHSLL